MAAETGVTHALRTAAGDPVVTLLSSRCRTKQRINAF